MIGGVQGSLVWWVNYAGVDRGELGGAWGGSLGRRGSQGQEPGIVG